MNIEEVIYHRAYDLATDYFADPYDTKEIINAREQIRAELLEDFENVEGPEIAIIMDEALTALGWPLDLI